MEIVEKKVLMSDRTLDMVERAVEMVCAYMPDSVADRCEDFVAEYGDEIIRLIVEMELSPREVCTALTLCHPHAPPKPAYAALRDDSVEDASAGKGPSVQRSPLLCAP